MINLAKVIVRAAQIRESAWNNGKRLYEIDLADICQIDQINLADSVDLALDELQLSTDYHMPAYLLLMESWDAALNWAKDIL